MFIVADETFMTAPLDGADPAAAIRRSLPRDEENAEVWIGPLDDDSGALLILYPDAPASQDMVTLAAGLIPGPDGNFVLVDVVVDSTTAATGGCQELAVRLLEAALPGYRSLYLEHGPRRILGDIGLTLPAEHHLSMLRALSYARFRIAPLAPLGSEFGTLEITVGESHRTRSWAPPGAEVRNATLLGQPVQWSSWQDETGTFLRETRFGQDEVIRVLVVAGSSERADALQAVAATLRDGVQPGRVRCRSEGPRPSWWHETSDRPSNSIEDYVQLRDATAVGWSGGFGPSPEREAFQRLVLSPEGVPVFRALVRRGSDAGRVFGLAGLYLRDPGSFAAALCATRPTLSSTLTVRGACGDTLQPTAALIESSSPDAIRGEIHWDSVTWSMASGAGTPDLVGGGLSHVLLRRDEADVAAWALEGEGHALVSGQHLPLVELLPGGHQPALALVGDRMCTPRRSDGRWICFGGRNRERAQPQLLPDVIRHPYSLIRPTGATCALDAAGQRVCFGRLLDGPIRRRTVACGDPVDEQAFGIRRFSDGPFRALFESGDGCGLTVNGEVRCFVLQLNRMPDWIDSGAVVGFGASYLVPIAGAVGIHDGLVWTQDGVVYVVGQHRSPERLGQLPGQVRSVVGGHLGPAFFQLEDGRVFAYAVPRADDGSPVYWGFARPSDDDPAFIEVPALAGAEIAWSGQHGCARFPTGRVSCFGWNQNQAIGPGDPEDRAPRDVRAFRAARAIFPAQRYTCALLSRGRLRCYGEITETLDPEARVRADGSREFDLARILSRASEP